MYKKMSVALAAMMGVVSAFANVVPAAPVAASAAAASTEVGFFAGMITGVLGFITGWTLVILAVLGLFGILAEHGNSRGWAVFWLLLAAAVGFIAFDVSLITLGIYFIGYMLFGVVWSFWRYKRHAAKIVEENRNADVHQKERVLKALHPKAMVGTITAWILIWPFSLVENIVGDLINAVQLMVTKFFRGLYHRVYDSAVAALK